MSSVKRLMRSISVDCVIFSFNLEELEVLLVERSLVKPGTNDLLFSDLTLTGYHIFEDEDFDSAACRIVKDLTGLENLTLEQFYAFGDLDRLEHVNDQAWLEQFGDVFSKRVVTIGYFALLRHGSFSISPKGRVVNWYPIHKAVNLAYDHDKILAKAVAHLQYKLRYEPVAFDLLPEKFTLSQLQKLYEAVLNTQFDKRNFRKKINTMNYIVPLNEKQKGVAHKPAQLFMFSRDIYNKTKKDRFDFLI